ncbi:rhodanese-like domain-containing protein [Rhodococcus sp. NPDC058505]|uniref:rhodanese-like domain-containing protein n=1 Tax=unclassified Rhodococcus (in: high G+C Gram-positive bacteria) TaxID=192944 RepID=UPI003661314D
MQQVDVNALAEELAAGAALIDVREADEYARARVPGAVLVPLSEFTARLDEIPAADPVYVICAMGGRSAQAAQYLGATGINAVNVAGGTEAWIASGRPVESGS